MPLTLPSDVETVTAFPIILLALCNCVLLSSELVDCKVANWANWANCSELDIGSNGSWFVISVVSKVRKSSISIVVEEDELLVVEVVSVEVAAAAVTLEMEDMVVMS